MSIMDGKKIAKCWREAIELEARQSEECGMYAKLAVVSVGDNPASKVYINNKRKACESAGIGFSQIELHESCNQQELEAVIVALNHDTEITAIILQLPIPHHLDSRKAIDLIVPEKDVDGLTTINAGRAMTGVSPYYSPCTPTGIIALLRAYRIHDLAGKHAVIVGRSQLVGKPLILSLLDMDATVTVCHSKTEDLGSFTRQADLLIVAVGKPKLITADMVKKDAIVIDVGINRVDGKLCGDVDFEGVQHIASLITPVPGGVGPMTVAALLDHTSMSACYISQKMS